MVDSSFITANKLPVMGADELDEGICQVSAGTRIEESTELEFSFD